jgi:heterodisulfide reductase subunit B
MEYLYYPGCSLEAAARQYDESLKSVFGALGVKLKELDDWNCCGATMYMSVDECTSMAISARNLALAAQNGDTQLMAPCSACYTVLLKTNRFLAESPELKSNVDKILAEVGLQYDLSVKIRHPLDVLVNDVGLDEISKASKKGLRGLRIAPYYGCQIVRPERGFDDAEFPETLDRLFECLGGESVYFPAKARCCGGMLMTTFPDVCLQLAKELLECASKNGAECIVTTCPLCQVNVEAYQDRVNRKFGTSFDTPVLFFTQLLGMALGCTDAELGLQRNLIPLTVEATAHAV